MEHLEVSFEQFIAGALTKFDTLSNFDINRLTFDFERKKKIQVIHKVDIQNMKNIRQYVKISKNGIIHFTSGYYSEIEVEREYIRKKILSQIAGDTITDYFTQFHIENFEKEKQSLLLDGKKTLINNLNILLISDSLHDYDGLLEYGFQRIDYFKSIVIASKYFENKQEELEKYHVIFIGSHIVNDKNFLEKLKELRDCLIVEVDGIRQKNRIELSCRLTDCHNNLSWLATESSYTGLLDRIIECLIMNEIDRKQKEYYPVKIKKQNELNIPSKKSDIKILCLDADITNENAKKLIDELNLNVEFSSKNISEMENKLGDYDVIIANNNLSNKLLRMSNEAREQAKHTGRILTLLVTHMNQHIPFFDEDNQLDTYKYGSSIHLHYIVNDSSSSYVEEMEFNHLYEETENFSSLTQLEQLKKKSNIKGIIEASVSLYNDCLVNPIENLECKDADTLDREYLVVENKEKKRQLEVLEPIYQYDNMKFKVEQYLKGRHDGIITQKIKGLVIVELQDSIYIKSVYENRPLCAIMIPKLNYRGNLREFHVQMAKNGMLQEKEKIGFYTRKLEQLPDIVKRPNEEQMKVVHAIEKKVDYHISPLIKNAWVGVDKKKTEKNKRKTKKKEQHKKYSKK